MSQFPIEANPRSTLPVLAFLIQGWKNTRDGKKVEISGTDSVFAHNGEGTVAHSIAQVLKINGLKNTDIISVTACEPDPNRNWGERRDIGSWDFWLFCRNPNADGALDARDKTFQDQARAIDQTAGLPG